MKTKINKDTRYSVKFKNEEARQQFYTYMHCALINKIKLLPFSQIFSRMGFTEEDPTNEQAVANLMREYQELCSSVSDVYQLMSLYDDIENARGAGGSWLSVFQDTDEWIFRFVTLTAQEGYEYENQANTNNTRIR